jgi:hypothetical protein
MSAFTPDASDVRRNLLFLFLTHEKSESQRK